MRMRLQTVFDREEKGDEKCRSCSNITLVVNEILLLHL